MGGRALVLAGCALGVIGPACRGRDPAPAAAVVSSPAPPPSKPAPAPKPPPATPSSAPRRVVIISEDGLRPDVLSADLTPRHIALMREGATARQAETIPESDTLPSHASMLSGVGAAAHGLWWNSYKEERGYIHVPTIFSAAHAAGLSTAMIVGKPKLRHIAAPGTVDHYERPSYLCTGVSRRAAEYFAIAAPDLMFVHFSDPDEYGHSHGWMSPEYLKAVKDSDHCLATVLDAIDASGLASTTLVIVTADHGGHGFRHSGGHYPIDRDIPWIVRGPGVTPGTVLDGTVETVDTAATVLAALKLPALPHMIGSSRVAF
ncbi:MAG TPA: alkaline phosphatase family protein [Kofleriaceae bacterium]|nr:alkaline phosphatase family protein [Kofleriaceae bacterium]